MWYYMYYEVLLNDVYPPSWGQIFKGWISEGLSVYYVSYRSILVPQELLHCFR